MQTIYLQQSAIVPNCSLISWSFPATECHNAIQKLITRFDGTRISCGNHRYAFKLLPNNPPTIPFSFHETDLLMQLMPGEVESFYLKAALREYMNAFTVINSLSERVYPEDII